MKGNRSRLASRVSRETQARFSRLASPKAKGLQTADDSFALLIAPSAAKRESVGNRLEVKLPVTSKPQTWASPFTVLGAISGQANPATNKENLQKASRNAAVFNHEMGSAAERVRASVGGGAAWLWAYAQPHRAATPALTGPAAKPDTKAAYADTKTWVVSRRAHETAHAKHSNKTSAIRWRQDPPHARRETRDMRGLRKTPLGPR